MTLKFSSSVSLRRIAWLAAGAASLLVLRPAAAADPESVARTTLTNGLQVVVVRNPLAPVVATAMNYRVGSAQAPAGFPGTAHALEHMMFRGSPDLSAEQLAAIGSVVGGDFNANTRETLTQYLFTVPAEDLDVALHVEASRMRALDATPADWRQERGALEQEVAQDLSEPGYVLYSRLRRILFAGTPYAHDALGTRPSFRKTSAGTLRRFYASWYAPNNALLVIAGNVDPQGTITLVRSLFGDIRPKTLPPRTPVRLQPVQPTAFSLDTDRPSGTQMLAMRTPGLDSPDFPALEVLADVLTSHRFDLYGLVPQGKALDAGFALDPLPQAGIAYATVSFTPGTDTHALESDVRAILARVAREGVPPELVEAAKIQERTEAQFRRNSIAQDASIWSDAIALYGLDDPDQDLERIERVSVADVNRVARQYLDLAHAVTAVMLPHGSGRPVPARAGGFGGAESFAVGEAKPVPLPAWAEAASRRLSVPASTLHPVDTRLPNGLRLIVQFTTVSDTVSVFGRVRHRPETEEPAGKEGVSQVLERLLPWGTEHLDRLALQRELDAIGAREQAGTDFHVLALAEQFERAVELLAQHQLRPRLPADGLGIVREQLAQGIAARNESPGFLTQHSLRQGLFPKDDPSLRMSTPASVRSLTLEDVRAYYGTVFRPDLTTVVVIGNVTPERARSVVERWFGGWSAQGPAPQVDLPPAPLNKSSVVAVPDASRVQSLVVLAHNLALRRSDPDYYALELGNAVLGGSFYSTRLSIDLRRKSGLVYSVGSMLQAGRTRGAYFVQYACDPVNVSKAAGIVVRDLKALQDAPPTQDELTRVKALLLRQIPLGEASVSGIAQGLLTRSDLGLGLDEPVQAARRYVELSASDVQSAFRRWLRPDDLVRVTQGPPGE